MPTDKTYKLWPFFIYGNKESGNIVYISFILGLISYARSGNLVRTTVFGIPVYMRTGEMIWILGNGMV